METITVSDHVYRPGTEDVMVPKGGELTCDAVWYLYNNVGIDALPVDDHDVDCTDLLRSLDPTFDDILAATDVTYERCRYVEEFRLTQSDSDDKVWHLEAYDRYGRLLWETEGWTRTQWLLRLAQVTVEEQ